MDEKEVLEQTNETENVDTSATEQIEGVELDTAEATEQSDVVDEKEVKFSQDDLDRIVKDRLSRQETKIREEYEEKYGRLETILNAGLGTNNVEDATERMANFYKEQGIKIPEMKLSLIHI